MKIGVISDTHIVAGGGLGLRRAASNLFYKTRPDLDILRRIGEKHFKGVDRILHAGDLVEPEVIEALEEVAPVDAVKGNMDHGDLATQLPAKKVLTLEGKRIGLIHGWGAPGGIVDRIRREFDVVDAIVFGHTHCPMNIVLDGVLFFNPGSPTDKRFSPYNAIGILNVDEKGITGEIIRL